MHSWMFPQKTPVIVPGQLHPPYDSHRAGAGHVLRLEDRYHMVYWGSDSQWKHYLLQAEAPLDAPTCWKPVGGPLLGPQPDNPFNCQGPGFPFLLPVNETRWLLYFCAWGRRTDGRLANSTGVGISDDAGRTWRYHDRHPVIPLDRPYDADATGSVWVLRDGDRFRMYYTAIGRYYQRPEGVRTHHGDSIPDIGIAYAESDDGLNWEKPIDHLLVAPRGFGVDPYEYICSKPCVIKLRDRYIMWVNTYGTAYRVHRLTSTDRIHWEWSERVGPDGEMGTGEPGRFDDNQRSYPTILADDDGTLHAWFTGNAFGDAGMGYAVSRL